ncbi:unnamed protein product [Peronospora belbahrii]|uniref:Uncharacterized protein n=1 Tax=Peronospora belbahrii TaxID=622444 RepID=A0AAU9KZF9_9STRA|nr:unnamed protein product [Peronospora belbahrii]
MSASRMTHLVKDLAGYAPWGGPSVLLVGWMAWPALSPAFKEETLGLKPTNVTLTSVSAGPQKETFRV